MLFFRSEELVDDWCRTHDVARAPLVTMPQLWRLAVAWYANRLDPDARRPPPSEMRRIFANIGLTGEFWDPQAD